jgi:transcriptional regulator with XRE-family HTH domain/tetratricopeptide (TPR) repeat protein
MVTDRPNDKESRHRQVDFRSMTGFGDLVRRHRMASGLTQAELAELTGLSIRSICDLERGATRAPRASSRRLLEQALKLPVTAPPAGGGQNGTRPVPRQLPAAVPQFVGRQAELAELTRLLDDADAAAGVVLISAIGGAAGVGKTELALHWAHQVAGRFGDGQLYVNLRGYDARPAITASEALASFLRGFGVHGDELPPATDDRAALYRTMLVGRRMLIMLDNAAEVHQLRPLLPGSPACAVIVTSRDSLPGLVARDGARRIDLDALADTDAIELLRLLIGERVDADPDAAAVLAAQCSRLPLALRIAAELAAQRPASDLADLVAELADRQRRLDLLDAGQDPDTAVRAILSWSYLNLSESTARVFRLIALHPGADIDLYSAAALTGLPPLKASKLLDGLARAHLVQAARPGRYVMHDLLRTYALELAEAQDSQAERRAARTRLFDHYLCAASAAMDRVFPAERARRPRVSPPAWYTPPALDADELAWDWLSAERASFAPVVECAVTDGSPDHAVKLAATLYRYFDGCGYFPEAATIHDWAYRAAEQTGDLAAQADALTSQSVMGIWQHLYDESIGLLTRALAISREAGDWHGESRAQLTLSRAKILSGPLEQAAEHAQLALPILRQHGSRAGECRALHSLADIAHEQGRHQRAIDLSEQALALSRQIGDPICEFLQLATLARAYRSLDRLEDAIAALTAALPLYRQVNDTRAQAIALSDLAAMHLKLGNQSQAADLSREAIGAVSQFGDLSGMTQSVIGLIDVLIATGEVGPADELAARLR